MTRVPGLTESGDGTGRLPDGRRLMVEPVGVAGYVIVRFVEDGTGDDRAALRLSVLGRDGGVVELDVVRELLAEGRTRDALALYPGPLLPHSIAPRVVHLRHEMHDVLRRAVVGSHDTRALQSWLEAPWGRDDATAWEALAGLQPEGSSRRLAAAEHARSLRI